MMKEPLVGREGELQSLRETLLRDQANAVVISGIRGIGKTALGYAFSEIHEADFPGGVARLHANGMEPLQQLSSSIFVDPAKRSLVMIDDVDQRPKESVRIEVSALRRMLPKAELILTTSSNPSFIGVDKTITLSGLSREQMLSMIQGRADIADKSTIPYELIDALDGHTLAGLIVASTLKENSLTPRQLFQRLHDFSASGIYDATGFPITKGGESERKIITDVTTVSDELLLKLHNDPKLFYELSPRGFEEVVAEILHKLGYDITLTPASRDGERISMPQIKVILDHFYI